MPSCSRNCFAASVALNAKACCSRRIEYALLYAVQLDIQDLPQLLSAKRTKCDTLSSRFMNSGVNLRRAGFHSGAAGLIASFVIQQTGTYLSGARVRAEPELGSQESRHFQPRRDCSS